METGEPYAMTSLRFMMQKLSAGSLVLERLWLQLDLQDLALAKVIITKSYCTIVGTSFMRKKRENYMFYFNLKCVVRRVFS